MHSTALRRKCQNTHLKVRPWFLIWLGELVGMAQKSNSPPSLFFLESRKRSPRGAVGRDGAGEGMTGCGWRREKGKGRGGEEDICSGRRRRMEKGKREWKKSRDWLTADLRQAPRLALQGAAESTTQAACSIDLVVRYLPCPGPGPSLLAGAQHARTGTTRAAMFLHPGRRQDPEPCKVLLLPPSPSGESSRGPLCTAATQRKPTNNCLLERPRPNISPRHDAADTEQWEEVCDNTHLRRRSLVSRRPRWERRPRTTRPGTTHQAGLAWPL